ncbi:hypothetical protein [Phytoactinopolyspora mesophila]|uniref:Uncharacterized protein n=1 Tax=Phytoactinopolyspora mesophila TaxID=2650750 RepID=A0A7K3MCC0_9ACTN|nr:hypothetical protein [Phytoactinopolyspora mesophila]NDL60969.1 hypothetical protein [Phytoactinopolyspora mesophila]
MSEPAVAPDALDEASASFWGKPDLDEVMAGAEPLREDESFEIADLTDDEWDVFIRAIHE